MSFRLIIACSYSSKRVSQAQRWLAALLRWVFAVSGIIAWLVLISGCSSVYHRTRNQLPPEPAGELNMRLAEADAAAKRVQRAGTTLRKTLSDIKLHSRLETDFDRLAAAVFEFERRVLAVRDSAAALGTLVEGVTIERLSARADLWVRYVRDARPLVDAERLRELDALLK